MRDVEGLVFDVMLESKVKDLALIRLRADLLRYAPEIAARFGLFPAELESVESETKALLDEEPEAEMAEA